MSRRKTAEELNAQLQERGIPLRLIGEYTSALTKALFRCDRGHECMMRPNDILNDHGCAMCAGHHKTCETFNALLAERGSTIRMTGEYLGAQIKTRFRCSADHEWMTTPNSIIGGNRNRGCLSCNDTRLSKDEVNRRLIAQGRSITLFGEYKNTYEHAWFKCASGHKWLAAPGTVLSSSGCPRCAKNGFDPTRPAHIYVIVYEGYIKYGITNNMKVRMRAHRRWGDFKIVHTQRYPNGHIPRQWEQTVKSTLGGNHVDSTVMENGYTETLPLESLDALLQLTHAQSTQSS